MSHAEIMTFIIDCQPIIYTNIDHVSASGMTRSISVYIVYQGEIVNITSYVSEKIDYKLDKKHYGMRVTGCGMDMAYHVVSCLSSSLFGDYKFLTHRAL